MQEIRVYRSIGVGIKGKVRTATIKISKPIGFVRWCWLWFKLRRVKRDKIEGIGIMAN